MLHHFLYSPFSNPACQAQYERVQATLLAESGGQVSLLLGNFAVEEGGEHLDAVVVRPHSITLLVFVPRGGRLLIPALEYGAWQLDNQPLSGSATGADNPFEQFRRQKEALASWLAPQLGPEQANLQFISGVVVFAAPVTFGPGVEEQLSSQPGGNFQLLGEASQLPQRLKQLAHPEIDLTHTELAQWAHELTPEPSPGVAPANGVADPLAELPTEKSLWSRAWGWLGAEDIPADPPYGGLAAAQVAASSAEKLRLERLQLEAQAEVRQQLQALEAREAERERSMIELRTQLAQAPQVTSEGQVLRERLAVENQEKASLEEAIRMSRAELEARNQALDAKISQLGQLIDQLHKPAATPSSNAAASAPPATTAFRLALADFISPRKWRHRMPPATTVAGAVGLLGLIVWGISRLSSNPPVAYQENGKWGFANEDGQPVIPARFTSVAPFQQKRAVVEESGVYGMIDAEGKEVVPMAYDALNTYADGYARVRVGDTYTFLDEQGQEFDAYYFNALDFSDGYAAVLDHRGWYYITGPQEADLVPPPVIFREAYAFHDGIARVKLADGYTYITKPYLTDPSVGTEPFARYEAATDFEGGKARVTQNGRSFTIDTDGDPVE